MQQIYVFDGDNRRVNMFDAGYRYVRRFPADKGFLKRIAVGGRGSFLRLREQWYTGAAAAVVRHDGSGAELAEWGDTPAAARIQFNLGGGGIDVDAEGNVYYGYVTGHRVWKTDSTGTILAVFDSEPDYYQGSDGRVIEEGAAPSELTKLIGYWLGRSRVTGLFLVPEKQVLFQQINTKQADGTMLFALEVWHTDGFKVATEVETPSLLQAADDEFLYFVGDAAETSNRPILVYEYRVEEVSPVSAP